MSEYQSYDFRALDRPLTSQERQELRALSTRAEIDAWSFTNEYHFGDFKGDPHKLMRKYFDAFLYFANWGSHRLAFRLPAAAFDADAAEPYCDGEVLSLDRAGDHVVVWFEIHREGLDWDEVEADLGDLLDVRKELLAGDLRPLYLGWLAAQAEQFYDEEETTGEEPPVPPGLKKLTRAQKTLADFLWLDEDVLRAAAQKSSADGPKPLDPQALRQRVQALTAADKDEWLARLLLDETPATRAELLARLRPKASSPSARGRTVAELRAEAGKLAEARRQEEQAAADKRKREEEAERERQKQGRLNALAQRVEAAWGEVERCVEARNEHSYAAAVAMLKDLRDLAVRDGGLDRCQARISALRAKHERKRNFITRLDKAGL